MFLNGKNASLPRSCMKALERFTLKYIFFHFYIFMLKIHLNQVLMTYAVVELKLAVHIHAQTKRFPKFSINYFHLKFPKKKKFSKIYPKIFQIKIEISTQSHDP